MRRGIVFSIDFVISLLFMFLVIFTLFSFSYTLYTTSDEFLFLNTLGQDAISMISKLKVSEALELEPIQYYIDMGDIGPNDLNRTISDVIGTFVVRNETAKAENITNTILSAFLPMSIGYKVTFNNITFDSRNLSVSGPTISVKNILSGYDINKSVEGYIARAWLEKATFNDTIIISLSPIGSAFEDPTCVRWFWIFCTETTNGGNLTITKSFEVPDDVQEITSSKLYLSLHENGGEVDVYVNGVHQYNDYVSGTHYASMTINNLTIGNNTLTIFQDEPDNYHAHGHPGTLLEIKYLRERRIGYFENRTVEKTEFLPEIEGHPVAWGIFPFHIPKNSTVTNATVHIVADEVDDEYEIWVNGLMVVQETSPPSSPTIDLDISSYLHLEDGLATGETNVLSLYFDMRGANDYPSRYAVDNCFIKNSSYIFLNYTQPETIQKYGMIPVTQTEPFDPPPNYLKTKSWDVQNNDILNAYLHLVQEYSWKVVVAAWHDPETEPTWDGGTETWQPSYMQVFKSPTGRNIPSSIYIPPDRLGSNTTNYVKARDTNGGANDILPNSTVEYVLLVPANVGYGEVFENETEAINNATARLQNLIEPYQIQGDIFIDSASIAGISWLWGPAEIKVILWT